MRLPARHHLLDVRSKALGILTDFFGVKLLGAKRAKDAPVRSRGTLVHIFVFEDGKTEHGHPDYVSSLVRSLVPESMVYVNVPISFFLDKTMPSAIGDGTTPDVEKISRYPFAWSKIKDTDPDLIEGLKVGKEKCTFSWEEYEHDGGSRGVLFAFYSLAEESGQGPHTPP